MLKLNNYKQYLFGSLLAIIILITVLLGVWDRAEMGLYDRWFNVRGQQSPGDNIVVIGMDEKSISQLGPTPWSRQVFADLLSAVQQAKVVAFDALFDVGGDPAADKAFMDAIQKQNHVVLGSMFTYEKDEKGQWYYQLKSPTESFAENCAGLGFLNMSADQGNTVRKVTIIDTGYFHQPYPAFSLAIAIAAKGLTPDNLLLNPPYLRCGDIKVKLDNKNQTLIDFWGPARTFPTYSFVDVINRKWPVSFWKDKIIVVGITTPEARDYFENPFTRGTMVKADALPLPGVEIHASAVKTFLSSQRYFYQAPWWVNIIILLLAALVTILASRHRSPWMALAMILGLVVVLSGSVYLSWLKLHLWINAAGPLIMIGVVYTGTTVENIVRTELEKRRTRAMFGRYVSPAVVDELLAQGEIELGGISKEVTILFSDIRGFTSFSEGKPAEEIVNRLNEYFTAMTEIIFRYGGTLDKYIGDGIMAIFGAPVHYDDHADRAIKAALEMVDIMKDLNQGWTARGEALMDIGVGINSGYVVIGNIGSNERMDYTAIGEEVNLASRLESQNKQYGTRIIISDRSYKLMRHPVFFGWTMRELGDTAVRGMVEAVKIYTLERVEEKTI